MRIVNHLTVSTKLTNVSTICSWKINLIISAKISWICDKLSLKPTLELFQTCIFQLFSTSCCHKTSKNYTFNNIFGKYLNYFVHLRPHFYNTIIACHFRITLLISEQKHFNIILSAYLLVNCFTKWYIMFSIYGDFI